MILVRCIGVILMVNLDEEIDKLRNKKDKKKTPIKKEADLKPGEIWPTERINKKLKMFLDFTPLEKEKNLGELAKRCSQKITSLRKQLLFFEKEKQEELRLLKIKNKGFEKQAGDKFTEKQFYTLQKYAPVENKTIQNIISEGLEFINMNSLHRGICKVFLNKILADRQTETSLKEQVLSLMHRKMFGEATELLVKLIEDKNYIYTTKDDNKSELWFFEGGIYKPNGESRIKEILRETLEENYNEWFASQILAKVRTDTYIEPSVLFKEGDPYKIPVLNGILDLLTAELTEFTPTMIFFSKIPVKYEPGATCPKIDKFLTEVLSSPEDKDVFYELAGFGLVKDYFMEKAFMFVGNGRNGKSKSLELLKRLVSSENCASVPLSALTPESPFVNGLWRKFFNLAGDLSSRDLKDTGMFKQLTGRDYVAANRKYKNVIEFCNYAKIVFACNDLPRVYDYSDGFWERWVLLEFPYKFVDKNVYDKLPAEEKEFNRIKDPDIIKKIITEEEMSGFLNMALLGLHRILKQKTFSYTPGCKEVKEKWIRKADSFMAFCMDRIEEDYETKVTKKEIRRKYKEYCDEHKVGGVSDRSIKATLQEMFGVMEEYSKLHDLSNNQEWCWTGIKFKVIQNEGV